MTDNRSADLDEWTDSPSLEGEKQTYRDLSRWIARHTDATVYWNETNDLGYDTFRTSGERIPDLLTQGSDTFVYEVKDADGTATEDGGSNHVNDGVMQLIEYWSVYIDGDVDYLIDGELVEIDGFVLATNMSPFGRLYMRSENSDVLRTGDGDGRQKAVQYNLVPNNEFNATERAVRLMWRFAEHQHEDTDVSIGALLSTRLDEQDPDPECIPSSPVADYEPRVLHKQFDPYDQSWSRL